VGCFHRGSREVVIDLHGLKPDFSIVLARLENYENPGDYWTVTSNAGPDPAHRLRTRRRHWMAFNGIAWRNRPDSD
jgi:hypothetical protein